MDPKNIMSLLPNDIILKIIREADGGRISHKRKMGLIFDEIFENEGNLWCNLNEVYGLGDPFMDDLAAFFCDRRENYESDEDYMDMVRNPDDYR
tara:strand:+ start:311 stop:592 length:282 start_codon:yes stop_codon:yes gene_type:complete